MNPTMEERARLQRLGDTVDELAELAGIKLHAIVLVGTYNTAALEGCSNDAHRAAVAHELRQAAAHILAHGSDAAHWDHRGGHCD